jgi:N-acyl-D-aspartate/D-glutamate deacylase
MLDLIIRGATVVDGTGAPGRAGDVGVAGGRVVAVAGPGGLDDQAHETLDATGLVVCPGFVDPHTHYDAQFFWDPLRPRPTSTASRRSSPATAASRWPRCGAGDADYLRRMMAKVEGMPLAALEQGVDWGWESFADYLDRLDGRIGLNAGFMVGTAPCAAT